MFKKDFSNILIIGLGLIGGSFAKLLRERKIVQKIYAFDPNFNANEADFIENINDLENCNIVFDLIIIASPLGFYQENFAAIKNLKINDNSLIIDFGSLKSFINKIIPKQLENNFVACHPICGSQNSGFENSNAEIFYNKNIIICPNKFNNDKQIKILEEFFSKVGCNSILLDCKEHDKIFALTSHLPQFLSFFSKEFSPKIEIESHFFKNAFRLDDSNPQIWEDIFSLNSKNIEEFYNDFFENLIDLIEKIDDNKFIVNSAEAGIELTNSEVDFLQQNFASIFFRFLIVESYLKTFNKYNFINYTGTGFEDFTSLTKISKYFTKDLIAKNQKKILKIFDKISL